LIQYEKNGFIFEISKRYDEFILLYQKLMAVFPTEKMPFLSEKNLLCQNPEILIYSTMKFNSFLCHVSKNHLMDEFLIEFLTEIVNKFFSFKFQAIVTNF